MKIKGKQLENTLRSESSPFDTIYADKTVGDLNGAIRFTALNNTGSTISAHSVVYINGVSGNTPTIALADADTSSMPAFGLTVAQALTGNEVDVITFGNLKGVDTSLLSVGDVLYVSTSPGQYTTTPPTGSSAKLQNIGMVVKSDSNGIIKVGGAGRSAATPNLDQGKFFIGNASNQSVQSSYTLPLSDGSDGQVLTTDGNGALTFATPSSGSSITTQRVTSTGALTVQKNYRYIIDVNIITAISVTLPASPSTGDTIYFLPRYNNKISLSSAGTETITRSGFVSEPYTELFSLSEGVEIKVVYSGTEWIVESPTQEIYNWSSYTINDTSFMRYDTIVLAYGTGTYTLPDQSLIPDGTSLEILFSSASGSDSATTEAIMTINAYNGNNEVVLLGSDNFSVPTSSITLRQPRRLKIFKYNSYFLVVSDLLIAFNSFNKNKFTRNIKTTSSSFTAIANAHYLLTGTSSLDTTVTLPSISNLRLGDEIIFSRSSNSTPKKLILSLDATDAADADVRLDAYGLAEVNTATINSVAIPLGSGIVHVKKIYQNGTTQYYDVRLLQSDDGGTVTVNTTSETLSLGFNYLIDTATAGGDVTLNLPYNDYEMVTYPTNIKVIDDTYNIFLKPYDTSSYIDSTYNLANFITLQAGNNKNRSITIKPVDRNNYKIISDTGANSNNYVSEITATTTLSKPYYGASSETYTVNHATNAITITLPPVASVPTGFKYNFKRIGAGNVTIDPDSTEYIDYAGQTQVSISNQYDNLVLQNTGSFWLKL